MYESAGTVTQIKIGLFNNGPLLAVAKIGLEFVFYQGGVMDLQQTYISAY